jgi:hypothetical protein
LSKGIWPNHAFEEGIGINTLTSAERGYPNGGGCFHDTAIWIRRAEAPQPTRGAKAAVAV